MLPRVDTDTGRNALPTQYEVEARLVEVEPATPMYEATLIPQSETANNDNDEQHRFPWWRKHRTLGLILIIGAMTITIGVLLTSSQNNSSVDGSSIGGGGMFPFQRFRRRVQCHYLVACKQQFLLWSPLH